MGNDIDLWNDITEAEKRGLKKLAKKLVKIFREIYIEPKEKYTKMTKQEALRCFHSKEDIQGDVVCKDSLDKNTRCNMYKECSFFEQKPRGKRCSQKRS